MDFQQVSFFPIIVTLIVFEKRQVASKMIQLEKYGLEDTRKREVHLKSTHRPVPRPTPRSSIANPQLKHIPYIYFKYRIIPVCAFTIVLSKKNLSGNGKESQRKSWICPNIILMN